MKIILLFIGLITLNGCSTMYLGIKKYDNFNPEIQADKLGPNVEIWEDGRRSGEKTGEYEWWYFDANLDDGSVIVAYFWKIKNLKNFYYIGVNYNKPNGEEYKKIKELNT